MPPARRGAGWGGSASSVPLPAPLHPALPLGGLGAARGHHARGAGPHRGGDAHRDQPVRGAGGSPAPGCAERGHSPPAWGRTGLTAALPQVRPGLSLLLGALVHSPGEDLHHQLRVPGERCPEGGVGGVSGCQGTQAAPDSPFHPPRTTRRAALRPISSTRRSAPESGPPSPAAPPSLPRPPQQRPCSGDTLSPRGGAAPLTGLPGQGL